MTMNNHTIRTYLLTVLLCMMGACLPVHASSGHADEGEPVNIKEIIFDHIGDAYEWHVATIGDKHISIPLPVIVYSQEKGLNAFPLRTSITATATRASTLLPRVTTRARWSRLFRRVK